MNKRSGQESKQNILKAAMDVFLRKGYAKASIREIARIAGISVGGVYLYFSNKEDLYRNLIGEKMLDIGSRTEAIARQTGSAPEALSKILALHFENALKHRDFILLHIREHGFAFGVEEKRKFFGKQKQIIRRIIQRGIASGEFRKCNPGHAATMIMSSLRGVILSVALDGAVVTNEMLNEHIFNGLHAK